jgi:serine/threonine-protein kinase
MTQFLSLTPGARLGPYEIVSPLGAGGMSASIQIANALDAAHRRGIAHRDVKPGNIMLTPGGAKLLDLGAREDGSGSRRRSG